jgi:phage terminase large subunit-like protein
VLANAIVQERTGSSFKPLSAEGQHQDGLNIHGAIIDEFHAHKDRRVWDVIETATGSRLQSLIWIITTAGFNLHGICYEMRSYVQKVLDGTVTDDSIFAAIYTLDDGDEWHDRRTWIKANPNLGVSVYADDIERQAAKAAVMPAALTNFLTKRLNCWVTASTQWIDARVWQKAAQPGPALAGMRYQSCYIGLDLATKNDLAALCLWFPPAGERRTHRLFFKLYVPEAALDREENAKLAEFARAGHIQIHRGPVCDYEALADDLDECGATYDVREIAGDPWQLPPLYSVVKRRSLEAPIVEVRQIVATLSPAMKETIALLLTGAIEHDGNPAVAWMVSNVVCHLDSKENWYPTKTHRANKIDAPIAMFIAAARIVGAYGADALAYENAREFKSVGVVAPPATNAAHSSLDELLRGL